MRWRGGRRRRFWIIVDIVRREAPVIVNFKVFVVFVWSRCAGSKLEIIHRIWARPCQRREHGLSEYNLP